MLKNKWSASKRKIIVLVVLLLPIAFVSWRASLSIYYGSSKALWSAVRNNDIEGIDRCLKYGANINSFTRVGWQSESIDSTALIMALRYYRIETAAHLLKRGADPNLRAACSPALAAVLSRDLSKIQLLANAGADFSIGNDTYTPLQISEQLKWEEGIILLRKILHR